MVENVKLRQIIAKTDFLRISQQKENIVIIELFFFYMSSSALTSLVFHSDPVGPLGHLVLGGSGLPMPVFHFW